MSTANRMFLYQASKNELLMMLDFKNLNGNPRDMDLYFNSACTTSQDEQTYYIKYEFILALNSIGKWALCVYET
jgi:hypothetical protein